MEANVCCCLSIPLTNPIGDDAHLKKLLEQEIDVALQDGYRFFLSRFSEEVDLLFARCVIEQRKNYPDIFLEVIIPKPKSIEQLDRDDLVLLSKSDGIKVLCKKCQQDSELNITRYLINQSSRVIGVKSSAVTDQSLFPLDYASTMERDLRIIEY